MVPTAEPSGNPSRKPITLNTNLSKGLMSYVAAACTASGAILASVMPADGEVVYTPANTPILVGSPISLDLNHDGIVDFVFSNNGVAPNGPPSCTICTFGTHASLKASPEQAGNAIWGMSSNIQSLTSSAQPRKRRKKKPATDKETAVPVPWGVVVGSGPGRSFQSQVLPMDSSNSFYFFGGGHSINSVGAWGKGRRATGPYMGFRFVINGEIHYGWARINVQTTFLHYKATLTGYAYETVANRPLLTGFTHGSFDEASEPSEEMQAPARGSLGQLALGTAGSTRRTALPPAH
jgi:hypothetical protein